MNDLSSADSQTGSTTLRSCYTALTALIGVLLVMSVLGLVVPFVPAMPGSGLEAWTVGMSEALGAGLQIGEDIVFTFGPLAGIYTKLYTPGFHGLTLIATSFVSTGIIVGIWIVARYNPLLLAIAVLPFFVTFAPLDALCIYAGLLFALSCLRIGEADPGTISVPHCFAIAVMALALGILGTVKGSFLVGSLAFLLLGTAALLAGRHSLFGILPGLGAAVGFVAAWALTGQPLSGIMLYLSTMLVVVSSYSEAMSLSGPTHQLAIFALGSALALFVTAFRPGWRALKLDRLLELASLGLFLLLCWKAGFVRHDAHALAAASALALMMLPVSASVIPNGPTTRTIGAATAGLLLVCALIIQQAYAPDLRQILDYSLQRTFAQPLEAISRARGFGRTWDDQYRQGLESIVDSSPLPRLEGTVDIYSYDQDRLVASGNVWAPRPVFQSYTAHAPQLARLNSAHLRTEKAADHLLVALQPIDGRYPTLADGASWPVFMTHYAPAGILDRYAHLTRRESPVPLDASSLPILTARMGEAFDVPRGLVFAEMTIEKTLFGHLRSLLFKPPQMRLDVRLVDGTERELRVISEMTESGFVLSPLIESPLDTVLVLSGRAASLSQREVVSARLRTAGRLPFGWKPEFEVRYTVLDLDQGPLPALDGALETDVARRGPDRTCRGFIDTINGGAAQDTARVSISSYLQISGWLADDEDDGASRDDVLINVTFEDGSDAFYVAKRTPRDDVRAHLGRPNLSDPGYTALIDLSDKPAPRRLRIATRRADAVIGCDNLTFALASRD